MSKTRTINDYYATVFLHRYHKDNPSKLGERIEIVVRIPEEAAKILFGSGRRAAMISHKIYRRAARIARQTVGMPPAPWAIFLGYSCRRVKDRDQDDNGARFHATFTKQRNGSSREWTRLWTFKTETNGEVSTGCEEISFDEKFLQLIQSGLTSATDIAQELGVAKSTICKSAKRMIDRQLVESNGRQ